jgi:hypothetical protein
MRPKNEGEGEEAAAQKPFCFLKKKNLKKKLKKKIKN